MPTHKQPAQSAPKQQLFAQSMERYNGGVRIKRQFGSSTVTVFMVGVEGSQPGTWVKIEGYGATPGARKTYALEVWRLKEAAGLKVVDQGLGDDLRRMLKS